MDEKTYAAPPPLNEALFMMLSTRARVEGGGRWGEAARDRK
jgi:hypothetical protein